MVAGRDRRTPGQNVYSLGVLLHELLCGQPPRAGRIAAAVRQVRVLAAGRCGGGPGARQC
ncbi:MAG: hypothetical protein R3F11_16565 [Verrucomicrobiales bacterium]